VASCETLNCWQSLLHPYTLHFYFFLQCQHSAVSFQCCKSFFVSQRPFLSLICKTHASVLEWIQQYISKNFRRKGPCPYFLTIFGLNNPGIPGVIRPNTLGYPRVTHFPIFRRICQYSRVNSQIP
jgi:hypothetical protein